MSHVTQDMSKMIFFITKVPEKLRLEPHMHRQNRAKKCQKVILKKIIVLVLLSLHAKRVGVSHMRDTFTFFRKNLSVLQKVRLIGEKKIKLKFY